MRAVSSSRARGDSASERQTATAAFTGGDAWLAELLARARVALVEGTHFGPGGEGFVRLNVGTTTAVLTEALNRLHNGNGRPAAVLRAATLGGTS